MDQVRILILTSSTGGGHDARAEAMAEWCFQLYRHDVDVRIEQMLEKSSVVNRSGVNLYNWIQRSLPMLHGIYYAIIELLAVLNRRTVSLGRGYYLKVLQEYRPHLIFSVHDCLNRGYFQLARKTLGKDKVRCVTYCGEFSGGWGYSINWIEPSADLYFSRTPTARDYAVRKGMPAERCRVRGHLMRLRCRLEVLPPEDRTRFRVKRLGLKPDLFTLFLATGGNGANNHFSLLPALLPFAQSIRHRHLRQGQGELPPGDALALHPSVAQPVRRRLFGPGASAHAGQRRDRDPRRHDDVRLGAALQVSHSF